VVEDLAFAASMWIVVVVVLARIVARSRLLAWGSRPLSVEVGSKVVERGLSMRLVRRKVTGLHLVVEVVEHWRFALSQAVLCVLGGSLWVAVRRSVLDLERRLVALLDMRKLL